MNQSEPQQKYLALRQEFDQAFLLPSAQGGTSGEDLLAIDVEGDPFAITLRDIQGVATHNKLLVLPSTTPHLLGLTGIRGQVVPVFSLASILGVSQSARLKPWLALCGHRDPVALAFTKLEGYLRLPPSAFCTEHSPTQVRSYVKQVVNTEGGIRPVIHIPDVVATISQRGFDSKQEKEK